MKKAEKGTRITVRLDDDFVSKMDTLAEANDLSRTDFVKSALNLYMSIVEKSEKRDILYGELDARLKDPEIIEPILSTIKAPVDVGSLGVEILVVAQALDTLSPQRKNAIIKGVVAAKTADVRDQQETEKSITRLLELSNNPSEAIAAVDTTEEIFLDTLNTTKEVDKTINSQTSVDPLTAALLDADEQIQAEDTSLNPEIVAAQEKIEQGEAAQALLSHYTQGARQYDSINEALMSEENNVTVGQNDPYTADKEIEAENASHNPEANNTQQM